MLRPTLLAAMCALSACGASVSNNAGAQAAASQEMSDEVFDQRLREALMRNPEIILEAVEAYRQSLEADSAQATRDAVRELIPTLVSAEAGHAIGASAEEADLVIVEFFDYHCGFCQRALSDVISRANADENVRVVFQELPILREESRNAALVALAAGTLGDDAYAKAHKALMQAQGLLDEKAINRALKDAGLNPKAINEAARKNEDALSAELKTSIDFARRMGVQGTPFFVLVAPETGAFDILEGYQPETLAGMINSVSASVGGQP